MVCLLKILFLISSLIRGEIVYGFGLSTIFSWFSGNKMEAVHYNIPAQKCKKIEIITVQGNIDIRTWKKTSIKFIATKYYSSEEMLKKMVIDIRHSKTDEYVIETKVDSSNEHPHVDFIIFIPETVKYIRSTILSEGSITFENNHRESNKNIGQARTFEAYTMKGPISCIMNNIENNTLILKTQKGPVLIKLPLSTNGKITAQTKHGTIFSSIPVTIEHHKTTLTKQTWKQMQQKITGFFGNTENSFIEIEIGGKGDIHIESL